MKKIIILVLTTCIFCTGLVSCKGTLQETMVPDDPLGATPTPVRTKNTVVIWWKDRSGDREILNDAWKDFKELYTSEGDSKYPDTITMFPADGNSDGTTELEMQIAAGNAPDLIRMDHVYITRLGQNGAVLDLNQEFYASESIQTQFIPSTWDALCHKNAVYGIPFDANTLIWGGKKAAMEKAGVSLPQTYNELLIAGEKLKNAGLPEGQYAYTLPFGTDMRYSWPPFLFAIFLWRLGGEFLEMGSEGNYTEAVFNDRETGVKAIELMLQLKEEGIISADSYQEGESVFCDYGTWKLSSFTEDMEFSLLPALKEGEERWSGLGLYGLSVVSSSKNPKLAYDFAVHLATGRDRITDDFYMYRFCRQNQFLPSLIAAGETNDFEDPVQKRFWEVSLEQLALSKYRPSVQCWPEIEEHIAKAVMDAASGSKSPAEALDHAKAAADALLQQEQLKK